MSGTEGFETGATASVTGVWLSAQATGRLPRLVVESVAVQARSQHAARLAGRMSQPNTQLHGWHSAVRGKDMSEGDSSSHVERREATAVKAGLRVLVLRPRMPTGCTLYADGSNVGGCDEGVRELQLLSCALRVLSAACICECTALSSDVPQL